MINTLKPEALSKNTLSDRIIYSHFHSKEAPTVVFFVGIHGNEPAGVLAFKNIIQKIDNDDVDLKGNVYVLVGNLNALQKNIRYEKEDLNRMWTREKVSKLVLENNPKSQEEKEQLTLYLAIKDILKQHPEPLIFIDIHTTSSETTPFITISDSLNNRSFASGYNLPIILGIEEFLEGPLLTYINEFGHASLGFEAGQHESEEAIKNSEAFIWLTLAKSKIIDGESVDIHVFKNALEKAKMISGFYEINYVHSIEKGENFKMLNGFKNFEKIPAQKPLATSNNKTITSNKPGLIFMPLYQKQGKEGFFIIKKVSSFWLKLSSVVRRLNLHHVLRFLIGVKKHATKKHILVVNLKTARYLTDEIFHLFGYRKKIHKGNKMHYIKRDREITNFS